MVLNPQRGIITQYLLLWDLFIFHSRFDRAFKRHPSPNLGILLGIGTWAEGGDVMGAKRESLGPRLRILRR
jgi:hypothetical protein